MLEKDGLDADTDLSKWLAAASQGQGDVEDTLRAVEHLDLPPEVQLAHAIELRTRSHGFALEDGIGVQDGDAIGVDDRGIVDLELKPNNGLQKIVQSGIALQTVLNRFANFGGIVGVAARLIEIAEVEFQGLARTVVDLVRNEVTIFVGVLDRKSTRLNSSHVSE